MRLKTVKRRLCKRFGAAVKVKYEENSVILSGQLDRWENIVEACQIAVDPKRRYHVVNDLMLCEAGVSAAPTTSMHIPSLADNSLDGETPDVLVIGAGISGTSIARELTRYRLSVLLVDKEVDVALHASGRNDGEIHPGVDLRKGTLKQHYVLRGNEMYDQVCEELDVPFSRCGQYVGFTQKALKPVVRMFAWQRRVLCGVKGTRIARQKELQHAEPMLNKSIKFAMANPTAGCVCPYGLTIAYAENAIHNGAKVSLETAVLGMDVQDGRIVAVHTNRGRILPKVVINAAGVFAEDIAKMAQDRFYSIHPRRGTNSILDSKAGSLVRGVASIKELNRGKAHTKGGGVLHTVHGNLLIGPNAVETYEKENTETVAASIDVVFQKQKKTLPSLSQSDIITYFTGVRAATFEEDFVIEKGRKTANLVHCAGIQSPGLTTAPAVAIDVAKMAAELVYADQPIIMNESFDPQRKGIKVLKNLPDDERQALIEQNPDYGVIVCRCEEISKGEILDALRGPLCVPTLDGVKKRVRPGMGRCQGGFCAPLVMSIIAQELGIPLSRVCKSGEGSELTLGETKGEGV